MHISYKPFQTGVITKYESLMKNSTLFRLSHKFSSYFSIFFQFLKLSDIMYNILGHFMHAVKLHHTSSTLNFFDQIFPSGKAKNYFVKGHLVARADKFYYPEQYSTYTYLNTVPMWQSINNGNWRSVETTVRRTAGIRGDLDTWTGGLGVLQLDGRDIYLAGNGLVPAPRLLFKLVRTGDGKEGLVFVTANDPYYADEAKVPRLCEEVHKECWERFAGFKKSFEGYTYCCRWEDFLRNEEVRRLGIPVETGKLRPLTLH